VNTVCTHEAGHAFMAHVLRCIYNTVELRNDGREGAVTAMWHSTECGGTLCKISGAIAERLADPNSDLRGSAQDFADLRRDGITISEDQIVKATTILGHGKKAIGALAVALDRDRVIPYATARKIVEKHIGKISFATKYDWQNVGRMDLSELAPAVEVPHGACKCDITSKGAPCDCDDQGDISFDQMKEAMVIRFGPGGVEAQQRFIAKCLAAKNAARHAAQKDDSMTATNEDVSVEDSPIEECDCDEDTDPEDRCEDCDEDDFSSDLNMDSARNDSREPLLDAATRRLNDRTRSAYLGKK
jgi:hypothetical protein